MIPAPRRGRKKEQPPEQPPTQPQQQQPQAQEQPAVRPRRGGVQTASWFYDALAREYDVGRIADVLDRLTSYRFTQEVEFHKALSDLRAIISATTSQWVSTLAVADPCTRAECLAAKSVAVAMNIMYLAHHLIYTTRYERAKQQQTPEERLRLMHDALRALRLIKAAQGLIWSAARGVAALSYVEPYGSWAFLAHLFRRRPKGEGRA
jgi:hypothetical protein